MSYLARSAGRLAGPGRPMPAMASRSPLALADQRLNLSWFAAAAPGHRMAPRERADAADDAAAPVDTASRAPDPAPPPRAPTATASAMTERPAPRGAADPGKLPRPSPMRAAPPREPPRPRPAQAVPDDGAAPRPGARMVARALPGRQAGRLPADRAVPPAPNGSPAFPAQARPERSSLPETRERSARPAADGPRPADPQARKSVAQLRPAAEPADPVAALTAALARASAWTQAPPVAAEPVPAALPAAPLRRREAPQPRLQIGRIEVEIVPPPVPQRAPRPARAPAPPMATAPAQRAFGWRQR